jgi:mannose-1-phosphate guanylyltransferase/mannose-6-phosphate isomerase
MFIQTDDSVHIPKGATHKVENNGTDNLVIIETQIGDICEESDIVRLEEIKE